MTEALLQKALERQAVVFHTVQQVYLPGARAASSEWHGTVWCDCSPGSVGGCEPSVPAHGGYL